MTSLATRYQKDACGVQKFIGKSSNYWSSSPNASNSDNAWTKLPGAIWVARSAPEGAPQDSGGTVSISTMATMATTTMFVSCAAESGAADPFSFESVWRAYLTCRRRKRNTANAQRYEVRLLDNILETATALKARSYVPSRSIAFVARHPKAREIHAADFSDRVIHHILAPRLEVLYEPMFIHDLYSNRKGKGIHSAVEQVGHFMRSVTANGVDFLGYITRHHYRLVRRRVVGNLYERLQAFETRLLRHQGNGTTVILAPQQREALRATLSSYLGHFRHANARHLSYSLWRRYPWLANFFTLRQDATLQPLWEPTTVSSLRSQWRYFRQQYPDTVILMQVGNRVERYNEDANLPKQTTYQSATNTAPHPPFDASASLPIKRFNELRNELRKAGLAHAFVAEEGYLRGGMKRRVLRWLWHPKQAIPHLRQETTQ